jgi:hypothetical protein
MWTTVQGRRECKLLRAEYEGRGQLQTESCGVDTREKPAAEDMGCPYRKPTQVGEASSLR